MCNVAKEIPRLTMIIRTKTVRAVAMLLLSIFSRINPIKVPQSGKTKRMKPREARSVGFKNDARYATYISHGGTVVLFASENHHFLFPLQDYV